MKEILNKFEINLNDIVFAEYSGFHKSEYADNLINTVITFLGRIENKPEYKQYGLILTKEQIKEREDLKSDAQFDEYIKSTNRYAVRQGFYYNILFNYNLSPDVDGYDLFFVFKLRQLRPDQVWGFLDYQHEKYHQDFKSFKNNLKIWLNDYDELISKAIDKQVNGWFKYQKNAVFNKYLKPLPQSIAFTGDLNKLKEFFDDINGRSIEETSFELFFLHFMSDIEYPQPYMLNINDRLGDFLVYFYTDFLKENHSKYFSIEIGKSRNQLFEWMARHFLVNHKKQSGNYFSSTFSKKN